MLLIFYFYQTHHEQTIHKYQEKNSENFTTPWTILRIKGSNNKEDCVAADSLFLAKGYETWVVGKKHREL